MSPKKKTLSPSNNGLTQELKRIFVEKLMKWNKESNAREMPWKGEKNPYKIWVSEIILQQTRVEQGLKYYEKFIKAFPTVEALAGAPQDQVFKLWEGLGYYSRCRNLIEAAKFIEAYENGVFPKDYHSILKLKGVGQYTASAIASFAYNLPHAVLDGNVFRVLSRVFDIEIAIDSTEGRKYFTELAQDILPKHKAREYNQAIMDFGAVICKPFPECKACYLNTYCKAYLQGKQDLLPVKWKKIKIKERWLNYFIVRYKDQVLIRKRTSNDIWQQLFEFVLIETDKHYKEEMLLELFSKQYNIPDYNHKPLPATRQKLTHQVINFSFQEIELKNKHAIVGFTWVKCSDLKGYAFPKSLQELVVNSLK
jgi:A/G-specific adenine glycosylase